MWNESNEVKLHSALICGFLDPLSNHYQGDVFLETFLECVGLKEYKNIDIYITNGERHIIIENKIWADDQPQQIQRYIEKIAKKQSKDFNKIESSENEAR